MLASLKKSVSSTDARLRMVRFSDLTFGPLKEGEVRVLVANDIHLGHNRVYAGKVIESLERIFCEERLRTVSAIVIPGDLFDKRLSFDSEAVHQITFWLEKFLSRCKACNVALRVLEGTPSHDNKQSRWITLLNDVCEIEADVCYYDKITIDVLYPNGPTVLYIPDEVNHDASKTWLQVNEQLREYGLETVDFAFMHGMFTYQEPIRTVVSHDVDRYQSIVKHRIAIGHHHTHTTHGKIVAPGSLERLRHNEEEEKGHYQFSIINGEVVDELFVINEEATIFKTLDVVGMQFNEVISEIKKLTHFKAGSHLRLKISRTDPAYASLRELKNQFPHYHITTKGVEAESYTPESGELIDRPVITAVRPDTIKSLIYEKITDASSDVMSAINSILEDC